MTKADIKAKIIQKTINLLMEEGGSGQLTSRQIAESAGINVAMINYYFKSKDELIDIAVTQLIKSSANDWKTISTGNQSPDEKLLQMLLHLSEITLNYYSFTKITAVYELIEREIHLPYFIIPLLEQHFKGRKNEFELKLIAFEIISFLQVIMIKADDFLKYSGKDIFDNKQREYVIRTYLDPILKN
ncbi:MAG: TetR/AcrR family transcriptional regulator [Sporolactobacillus sp.]